MIEIADIEKIGDIVEIEEKEDKPGSVDREHSID